MFIYYYNEFQTRPNSCVVSLPQPPALKCSGTARGAQGRRQQQALLLGGPALRAMGQPGGAAPAPGPPGDAKTQTPAPALGGATPGVSSSRRGAAVTSQSRGAVPHQTLALHRVPCVLPIAKPLHTQTHHAFPAARAFGLPKPRRA